MLERFSRAITERTRFKNRKEENKSKHITKKNLTCYTCVTISQKVDNFLKAQKFFCGNKKF